MTCLHCGDCCLRMSPLGSPCPKLEKRETFYFCGDYENRPEECVNHRHPFRFCPIGISLLDLRNTDESRNRIDTGYEMTRRKANERHR